MIQNLLKVAVRNILAHKSYVFINISGLAIGLACSILIFLFVKYELSYDTFNEKKDRIYRLVLSGKMGEQEIEGAWTASPIAPTMKIEMPEVEEVVRMDGWGETVITYHDKKIVEKKFMMADSTFFDIFSIPLIKGDPQKALSSKYTVVLTEKTAKKIFGQEDPIDKLIRVGTDTTYYRITGICGDVPENAHFSFNMLGSFVTSRRADDGEWLSNSFSSYVLLKEGTSHEKVNQKISGMIEKHIGPLVEQYFGISLQDFYDKGNRYSVYLQALSDIHLNIAVQHDMKPSNDRKYIFIFSIVAMLVLVIASINYMNLSTARSASRSKEVGIRKVVGSMKQRLVWQFLLESMVLTIMAMLLAVLMIELSLPNLRELVNMPLYLNIFSEWFIVPGLLLLAVTIGILAGSYPAFYLSAFQPVSVLSGSLKAGSKKGKLRSILVVLQFAISIILILGTLIMYKQIRYLIDKDLGFKKEQLMVIQRSGALEDKIKTFRQEIKKIPGVVTSTHSTAIPGHPNNNNGFQIEGEPADKTILMQVCWADYDQLQTYGLSMKEGRYFSQDFASDSAACVINESAVKQFNLQEPLKTRFIKPGDSPEDREYLQVIGVVKDFHFESLHDKIYPHVFILMPKDWTWGFISVKVSPDQIKNTVNDIENTWKKMTSNDPLQFFFMDEEFASLYKEEQRNSNLALLFAILAIFIASLGLFGLTSFTAEQRTKEIGIRKAMGSSVREIIILLFKEVLTLVFIATAIAWPLSYILMKNWLNNFYYRIDLGIMEFLIALAVTLVIAMMTISYQALKAATANPADSLRYE